jgi:hypothetical protein
LISKWGKEQVQHLLQRLYPLAVWQSKWEKEQATPFKKQSGSLHPFGDRTQTQMNFAPNKEGACKKLTGTPCAARQRARADGAQSIADRQPQVYG